MRKSTLKIVFQNLDKNLLSKESLCLLELYFIEDYSLKQISIQSSFSQTEARQKIARAIYELKKASNDPEYLKAKAILYGDQNIR